MTPQYEQISVDRITDPDQPLRADLTEESVGDLVESIKSVGIIEPLIVKRAGDNFEVIAGHRRLLAARIAGTGLVPCIIREENGLEAEILKVHENLARAEISPIDWAKHLSTLKQQYNLTTAKIAEILGMSESWVGQHLDILNYPTEIYQAVAEGKISFSAARELALIKDATKRQVYARAAIKGGVTPALAAQWRREANTAPYKPQENPGGAEEQNTQENTPLPNPICPVCKEEIPFEEQVTVTIHTHCQPQ